MISLRSWIYRALRIIFTPTSFFKDLKDSEEDGNIPLQFARTSAIIGTTLLIIVLAAGYIINTSFYSEYGFIIFILIGMSFSGFIRFKAPLGVSRQFYSSFGNEKYRDNVLLYSSAFTSLTSWIPLIPLFYMLNNNPLGIAEGGFLGSGSSIITGMYLVILLFLFLLTSVVGMSMPGLVWGLVPLTIMSHFVLLGPTFLPMLVLVILSTLIFLYHFYIQYRGFTALIDVEKRRAARKLLKTVGLFGLVFPLAILILF